jgi:hypothetical protein
MTGWLAKHPGRFFATTTLAGHLVRGAFAFALFAFAISGQQTRPMLAIAAALLALVLMRGCPVCWTIGLAETLLEWRRRR